jgi:hypothetical protein
MNRAQRSAVRSVGCAVSLAACLALLLSPLRLAAADDPAKVGQWSDVFPWPVVAIHAHLLPNGKVLSWERKDDVLTTETWLWEPATGKFEKFLNEFASVFCSGHTFLPDGTLLVAGGHHFRDGDGEKTSTFFDFKTNKWTKGPDMNAGRWYPTTCMLSNGEVLAIGGSINGGEQPAVNALPQVWKTTGGWRDLTDADGEILPLYPFMLLAPDGKVFYAGPETRTLFLDTSGLGAWSDGPVSKGGFRDYGSAVQYEPGKMILIGGGDPPFKSAEIVDLNVHPAEWKSTGDMAFARRQLNATLLPDGKILATGGSGAKGFNNADGSVLAAELWDAAAGPNGQWTTMASMKVRRLYHSTALLLPDGRVLSAGGGMPASPEGGDANHFDAQIYSPPYLFKGARPVIDSAPESVGYGQAFTVKTKDAASIKEVTWVRLSSVTHAFNQGQSFNRLKLTAYKDYLTVTAPAGPTLAPPGHYMLFLLNGSGVPSVAKIVKIPG